MSDSVAGEGSRSEQIIRAATQLFSEKTYHGTSVKDIADAVGMLKSSLYYYFDSKEKLLADIILEATRTLQDDLLRLESKGPDVVERLRRIIFAIVQFNANYREAGILWLTEQYIISSLDMKEVKEILLYRNRLLTKTLSEGIEQGLFQKVNIRTTTLAIVGLCNSVLAWYRPSGRLSYHEIADSFFEIMHSWLTARTKSAK